MNKTLKEIILDWIGEDIHQDIIDDYFIGQLFAKANQTMGKNQALSDLRARVPELVADIAKTVIKVVEDTRGEQDRLYSAGLDPFAKIIFSFKRSLYNVDEEGYIINSLSSE